MKRFFIFACAFLLCSVADAQLVIYSNFNLQGTSGTCVVSTIYTDATIPNSLNNGIKSMTLSRGYMATVAENADGSGERFSYMAVTSDLNVNLAMVLQNKVSFIRVMPLPSTPVKKKGAGAGSNNQRDSLNVSWFYDWGRDDVSTTTQEYAPMMWGAYNSIENSINTVVSKTNVSHFMAFNEPDNAGQGGGSLTTTNPLTAIPFYKKLLRSGHRMLSPSPTEGQDRVWLRDFANEADAQKLQIDAIGMHWYDWGNICTNFTGCDVTMPIPGKTISMDVNAIFTRFKNSVNAAYTLHKKPIWITEFNASKFRPDAVQAAFMALALPWLDANPNVERYAYFFGNDAPVTNLSDRSYTAAGLAYANHASVNAYPENIYDTRPASAVSVLASWESSSQTGGGLESFTATYLDGGMTPPSALTRGTGVVLAPASSAGYWGGGTWSTTTAAAGVSSNKFLKFSLKANQTVSYSSIDKFNIRISSTGPIQYQIDYQIDNGAFNTGVTVNGATRTTANFTLGPIDLSNIAGLQNVAANKTVTFRITPFDASGLGSFLIGSGTGDTNADLSISGSFSSASNLIVLPITLSDFQSKKVKDKVLLTWKTQSAINFSHFILERSTDGKTFYDLAKIDGSNLSDGSKYDYTDNTPDATTANYYRLKMVDLDGSFAYSKILSENYDASDAPLTVYPSISNGSSIEATFKKVSESAQIKIFNINGQLLSTHILQAGASSKTIDIAQNTEGVYFLILQDKGTVQSQKFIKQ